MIDNLEKYKNNPEDLFSKFNTDLEEKISYYSTHIDEAEQIIKNAQKHVERFKNPNLEDLLCLKVLEKYANLSGQSDTLKFQ